ncbi:DUF2249 domain-containing protein [Paenibacillus macerans]|uniref:DUF2249 domain-containing protein n=1 Tax=Paenibacillus macerans TaxID=44252 RepID=UPI002041410D|nr:DUF2249 domain-containing protein [Paenibacillus macerans]MCM3702979.1 DUF2249 domain-containing protein [Paenibacillus macerans]
MENRGVELDVRPQLRQGEEPFGIIMDAFERLEADEIFVLHATIKPVPLLKLLETKGYTNECEQLAADHWKVTFKPGH